MSISISISNGIGISFSFSINISISISISIGISIGIGIGISISICISISISIFIYVALEWVCIHFEYQHFVIACLSTVLHWALPFLSSTEHLSHVRCNLEEIRWEAAGRGWGRNWEAACGRAEGHHWGFLSHPKARAELSAEPAIPR